MYLYHYSASQRDILKSLKRQGGYTQEQEAQWVSWAKETDAVAPYYENISFICGPIEGRTLVSVIPNHPFWKKGNIIFEHVVEMEEIDKDISFMFVETPDDMRELMRTPASEFDKPGFTEQYLRAKNKRKRQTGEIVDSCVSKAIFPRERLELIGKKYNDPTEWYIKKYRNQNYKEFWEDGKYASCVPHVMLYPKFGEVRVSFSNRIEL